MKLFEEIYTSSAELLDGGSGNLGIVARTRGFPVELEGELNPFRSYSLVDQALTAVRNAHPARFAIAVCGNPRRYLLVSQTVSAGADHTGRNRPLSHQVLVPVDEIDRSRSSPAIFAKNVIPLLVKTWNEKPRWIDPPRELVLPNQAGVESLGGLSALTEACVFAIADALATFPTRGRCVVVCLPQTGADRAVDIAVHVLSLLPRSVQWLLPVASHVVEVSDCPRGAALVFTYPDTPFLSHSLERQDPRKPLVFDLRNASHEKFDNTGPFASALASTGEPCTYVSLVRLSRQWDEWGLAGTDATVFSEAYVTKAILATAISAQELPELGYRIERLCAHQRLSAIAANWCRDAAERIGRSSSASRWETLVLIQSDRRWPQSVREFVLSLICENSSLALPTLTSRSWQVLPDNSRDALLDTVFAEPGVAERSLASAVSNSDPETVAIARTACERLPWSLERTVRCIEQLLDAPPQVQASLLPVLLERTAKQARRLDEIAYICGSATTHAGKSNEYPRHVCEILLRPFLKRAKPGPALDQLAKLLMRTSSVCGRTTTELRWITETIGRNKIGAELLQQWSHAAGEIEPEANIAIGQPLPVSAAYDYGSAAPPGLQTPRPFTVARTRIPVFVPWLFPSCIIAAVLLVALFCWSERKNISGMEDLDKILRNHHIVRLAPVIAFLGFEVVLSFLTKTRWIVHAVVRTLLLIGMIVCIAWIVVDEWSNLMAIF